MDTEKFAKDMTGFSFSQHQDTINYLNHLKLHDWTIKDAREWVELMKKRLVPRQPNYKTNLFKTCPLCQASMSLLPLNFNRATVTGEDSQSVWLCSNQKCMNTIYNKETVAELRSKGGT